MNCARTTIILVAVLLMVAVSAEAETQAWDFLFHDIDRTEFAVGILASFAGGLVGFGTLFCLTYVGLQTWPGDAAFAAAMNALIGYPLGAAIGATLGVIKTGWALKDEGNELLAGLGSVVGLGASYLVLAGLANLFYHDFGLPPWLVLIAQPIGAAAGATVGYNWGDGSLEDAAEATMNRPLRLRS